MKFEEKTESSRKPSSASVSELEAEEFHDDFAEALEDIDLDELLAMADDDTASNASSKGLFFSWKCCIFVLFSSWQLWFHEKNYQIFLGEKFVKKLWFWTF